MGRTYWLAFCGVVTLLLHLGLHDKITLIIGTILGILAIISFLIDYKNKSRENLSNN